MVQILLMPIWYYLHASGRRLCAPKEDNLLLDLSELVVNDEVTLRRLRQVSRVCIVGFSIGALRAAFYLLSILMEGSLTIDELYERLYRLVNICASAPSLYAPRALVVAVTVLGSIG